MEMFFGFAMGLGTGVWAMNYLWEEKIREIIRTGEYTSLVNPPVDKP